MHNRKFDFLSRIDELPSGLYIVLGIVGLAIHILLGAYTEISATVSGLVILLLYALLCSIIFLFSRRKLYLYRTEQGVSDEQNMGVVSAFRDEVHLPYAVVTDKGKIITVNAAFRDIVNKRDTFFNTNIADICQFSMDEIIRSMEVVPVESDEETEENPLTAAPRIVKTVIGSRTYRLRGYYVHSRGLLYYMITFSDITDYLALETLHRAKTPCVAYILLDNLDEIAQYVKGSYRAEAAQVDGILKAFSDSMNGILREYDRNKYIMLFNWEHVNECVQNKFDILDEVRAIRIGDDSLPLTISMGVATTGETLEEREHDALAALDMAVQRGGDQVVLKEENGITHFGGKTKSQQKRTNSRSRIIGNKLCAMINASSNVIITGHTNPDFDSIGACVGIAALAMHLGAEVKIVTDTKNENFLSCTEKLLELPEYKHVFVDSAEAIESYSYSTLVIVVDTNNFTIIEGAEIARNAEHLAIIDHHIKKEEFEREPEIPYIDPTASSACELVTEILEQTLPAGELKKEEANVMLAGIMVDTKNFTRTVGTRTFAAALYLRSSGGNTEIARTYFHEAFEDYRAEALFGADVDIYREQIAITMSSGTGSPHDRIAAAKTADKLLTIRNVNAAFALVQIGDIIHVSARSNGKINVQLILEKIGGGGHFDMAGATVKDHDLKAAKEMLLAAIDSYYAPAPKKGAKEK